MKFTMVLFLPFLMCTPGKASYKWSKDERSLYRERRFIELEQDLAGRGKADLGHFIQVQQNDLAGCRALHQGAGGIVELVKCFKFLNREGHLGLVSPGRQSLARDVNILCPRLLSDRRSIEILTKTDMTQALAGRYWKPCLSNVWKQVYLTAYASFDADPVGMVAFVNRAQQSLPPDIAWKNKITRFLKAK